METIRKAGSQAKNDPFEFVLSTADVDRDGDVIEPAGIDLEHFRKNPIALFLHNHNFPIGTWSRFRVEGKKLIARLKLAEPGTDRLIDRVRALIEQRILKAVSIGFTPVEYKPRKNGGYHFTKTSLHEASVVPVPANPHALRVKNIDLSDEEMKLFFIAGESPSGAHRKPAAKSGRPAAKPGVKTKKPKRKRKMDIAEKLKVKHERLVAIKDRLTELKGLGETEDYDLTEDEENEVFTLSEEQDTVIKSIESLEKIEAGLAAKAKPVKTAAIEIEGVKKEPGGTLLAKMATAQYLAHVERKNVDTVVQERYGDDDRVGAVIKTAAAIADSTTTGWAAELVGQDIQGFIDLLKPISVYANLARMGLSINFGRSGQVTIPRRGGSNTDLAGAFVGESGVIPVKRGTTASAQLNRYKLAVISTFSKELQRMSTPNIEMIIREAMLADTAVALDNALLDGVAAVNGVRPASILDGVAGHASGGATTAAIIADLKTILGTLMAANAATRPVLIMNSAQLLGLSTITLATGGFLFREELATGRLLGVPVVSSTTVPTGNVIIVDAAYFATAFGMPEVDVSDTATLTMADADTNAPTQAEGAAGAVGTAEQVPPDGGIDVALDAATTPPHAVGYQAQSMYQTWSVAVRFVMPVSWAMTRAGVIDRITGATW